MMLPPPHLDTYNQGTSMTLSLQACFFHVFWLKLTLKFDNCGICWFFHWFVNLLVDWLIIILDWWCGLTGACGSSWTPSSGRRWSARRWGAYLLNGCSKLKSTSWWLICSHNYNNWKYVDKTMCLLIKALFEMLFFLLYIYFQLQGIWYIIWKIGRPLANAEVGDLFVKRLVLLGHQ